MREVRSIYIETIISKSTKHDHHLASEIELGLALGGVGTPVSLVGFLSVVTDAVWLERLVEGLEVECINTPVEKGAVAVLVESASVIGTGLGCVVVGSASCASVSNCHKLILRR